MNGAGIPLALVEVFDRGDWIVKDQPRSPWQKRLIGCITNGKGSFGVIGLKKGTYELRVSIDSGWNHTVMYVRIDPRRGRRKTIEITPSVGT